MNLTIAYSTWAQISYLNTCQLKLITEIHTSAKVLISSPHKYKLYIVKFTSRSRALELEQYLLIDKEITNLLYYNYKLNISSGQGVIPYRRYSPRTVIGWFGLIPKPTVKSGWKKVKNNVISALTFSRGFLF